MKIKEYINSCGLTQAEFSKLLGVSESHICQIIKGIKNPSVKLSKKIEKVTDGKISVIELLDIAVYKNASQKVNIMPIYKSITIF